MKPIAAIAALLLAVGTANAQRHTITINTETPEGALLQQIGQEEDAAKKIALLEQFAAQYPKHEGTPWVYEQLVEAYTKASQPDKVVESGEKLLALDPNDAQTAHACLKAALELKRDPDLVLKWAVITSDVARKLAQAPKPSDEDEVEDWKQSVDYAKQLDVYTEYSLYAMALQTPDPQKKIALGDLLEQRNPESQYVPMVAEQRFLAYIQAGDNAKAVALAEKTLQRDQSNAEMMLAVASSYMGKQNDKVLELTSKAIEVMNTRAKPEGVSDADWENRKKLVTGRANYMQGVLHATSNSWVAADKALRAALPGIADSADMRAEALFYLGLANYRLAEAGDVERARDALRFSQECANIPGRFQARARQNVKAIQSQYRIR
ncbi:MAG: tetratricopeptide repeat protein [Rhodospirillales bacterium]